MEIGPDLAGKVLGADMRNAIQGVTDGGTLPAEHRKAIRNIAMTPETAQRARVAGLIQKWVAGHDLTPAQLAEVRKFHPDFAATEKPEGPHAESGDEPAFALTGGKRRLSRTDFERWERLYGKEARQIRRWMRLGLEKGDPCPLDDAAGMPAWWARNMKWRVPDEILAAAKDAAQAPDPPSPNPPSPDPALKASMPGDPVSASIDLAGLGMDAIEDLQLARALVAAAGELLKKAYAGQGGDVDLLQRRYEKARKNLKDVESSAREEAKQRGLLISRDIVRHDIARAVEMLRQLRASMPRRVKELCPGVPPEIWDRVAIAIITVREAEDRVFRTLATLKSPEDVLELAPA